MAAAEEGEPAAERRAPEPAARRRRGRRWPWSLLVVVLGLVAVLTVTAWQALQARDALLAARPQVATLQEQLTLGDTDAATATLSGLQGDTARARAMTSGPVWAVLTRLPGVGDDVRAARVAAAVVDDVAQRAMPALVQAAAAGPQALAPVNGAIDLAPIQAAQQPLETAEQQLAAAHAQLVELPLGGVVPEVAEPVEELRARIGEAVSTAATASTVAELLPPMLGAQEPRSYLLMFQNNAEVRATGGLPGALAVVNADDGRLTLGHQLPASSMGRFDEPVIALEGRTLPVNGERPGVYPGDVNFTPHFPTSAEIIREMWRRHTGQQVDGVLSVDPVALSYLLQATGPVELPGGVALRPDDAVRTLLSDAYQRFEDPRAQDAFFGVAAAAVFGQVTQGEAQPEALRTAIGRAVDERRLLVWSARESEQEVIAATPVAGGFGTDPGSVGVFLNDATASKMSYYLRQRVTLDCPEAEDGTATLTIGLSSTAPTDAAATLPESVTGTGRFGTRQGSVATQVLVYAPEGAGVTSVSIDGETVPFTAQEDLGRQVAVLVVTLAPGEDVALGVVLKAAPGTPTALVTTPMTHVSDVKMDSTHCHD